MKALMFELLTCAVGLALTVWSVIGEHQLATGVLGVVFTAIGFGMLLVRLLEHR
jgi:hypothetical protein